MANLVVPLMLAGTVVSAIGATQSATAQKNAALYNARLEEMNAQVARQQTDADVARFERAGRKELGAMRAAFGASGGMEDALSVLADAESTMQLDKATLKYRGDLRAYGHQQSATLSRFGADTAEREGQFKTASQFLSGAGSVALYGTASGSGLTRAPSGGVSKSFLE